MRMATIFAFKSLTKGFIPVMLIFAFVSAGCGKGKSAAEEKMVKAGDKVKIMYKGTLEDGSVFDSTQSDRPFEFVAGVGSVIPGFDQAVTGMKLNEKKQVTIKAAEAYGPRNENMFRKFPHSFFPADMSPKLEMVISLQGPNGREFPGKITEITADSVTVDLNHPLAGKDLTFEIELVGIETPPPADTAAPRWPLRSDRASAASPNGGAGLPSPAGPAANGRAPCSAG